MWDVPTEVEWRDILGVGLDIKLEQVVCGPTDTALVLSDGRCFTSGTNKYGQLGHGHKDPIPTPTEIPMDVPVSKVFLGHHSMALLDKDGDLYTCGNGGSVMNGMGQLGHGDGQSYLTPKLVESLIEDGCYAKQVHLGDEHMAVLTTEGEVLTAGSGSYGRLGNFETTDQLYLEPVELLSTGVVQICGGKAFTLALTKDGLVQGWGRNDKGQLGTGFGMAVDMYAMANFPTTVESDEFMGRNVVEIAAGDHHSACVTSGGELFEWGSNVRLEPELVNSLMHTKIVHAGCGLDFTIAQNEEGQLYSFGKGKSGSLGLATTSNNHTPTLIEALDGQKVVALTVGGTHVACLTTSD